MRQVREGRGTEGAGGRAGGGLLMGVRYPPASLQASITAKISPDQVVASLRKLFLYFFLQQVKLRLYSVTLGRGASQLHSCAVGAPAKHSSQRQRAKDLRPGERWMGGHYARV